MFKFVLMFVVIWPLCQADTLSQHGVAPPLLLILLILLPLLPLHPSPLLSFECSVHFRCYFITFVSVSMRLRGKGQWCMLDVLWESPLKACWLDQEQNFICIISKYHIMSISCCQLLSCLMIKPASYLLFPVGLLI